MPLNYYPMLVAAPHNPHNPAVTGPPRCTAGRLQVSPQLDSANASLVLCVSGS